MNYEKIYYSIIDNAKKEYLNGNRYVGYYETHHIKPKSLGGSNDKTNLVLLTAREHFICHALLVRFLTGNEKYKMKWAFFRLCSCSGKNNPNHIGYVNSRLYENFKKDFQKGNNNSQYGKKWCYNKITGEIAKFKTLPSNEWVYGRKKPEQPVERIKKHSKITIEIFNDRVDKILNSGVDLTKYGWISKVAKITNLTRREIFRIVNHSELLKSKVFRRN